MTPNKRLHGETERSACVCQSGIICSQAPGICNQLEVDLCLGIEEAFFLHSSIVIHISVHIAQWAIFLRHIHILIVMIWRKKKNNLYLHFECNVKLKHNPLHLPGMPAYHYHHRIVFGIRYISFQTHIMFQVNSYRFFRVIISDSIFIHKKYTYIYLFITST